MYTKNCQNAWTKKTNDRSRSQGPSTVGPAHGLTIWGRGYGSIKSSVPPSRAFLTFPPNVYVPSLNTIGLISASVAAISVALCLQCHPVFGWESWSLKSASRSDRV